MLDIGETFPNFVANSSQGEIELYSYLGHDWCVIECHPKDFTPVCTTEISRLAQLSDEFQSRKVKVICISVDVSPNEEYNKWIVDIEKLSSCEVPFPLIGDQNGKICKQIGIMSDVRTMLSIILILMFAL